MFSFKRNSFSIFKKWSPQKRKFIQRIFLKFPKRASITSLMKKTAIHLTDAPILRPIITFAIPMIISNIFQQLYNTADIIIVGRFLEQDALAAVGRMQPSLTWLWDLHSALAMGWASSSRATTEPTNRIGSLFYVPLALLLILRNSLQGLGQKVKPWREGYWKIFRCCWLSFWKSKTPLFLRRIWRIMKVTK